MPKRTDIKKILVLSSGATAIGSACEFDYSGVQACRTLRERGYEVILVNPNSATVMTDPQMTSKTYAVPLNKSKVKEIIELEKPDALLPNFGEQAALNLSIDLFNSGLLAEYNVEVIGVDLTAIEKGEISNKRYCCRIANCR